MHAAADNAGEWPEFAVDPRVAGVICPGLVVAHGLRVEDSGPAIESALSRLENRLRDRYGDTPVGEIPMVHAVRAMFRALRIDPTRRRPSSEALLRRVLRCEQLYRISNAVDLCNLCSLETLVPMGLYDLRTIEGPVRLALGEPGAGYDGIRKARVSVADRPTLIDARGPFGAPTSDSARTQVQAGTTALALVIFAPAGLGAEEVRGMVDLTAARYQELGGIQVVDSRIMGQ